MRLIASQLGIYEDICGRNNCVTFIRYLCACAVVHHIQIFLVLSVSCWEGRHNLLRLLEQL